MLRFLSFILVSVTLFFSFAIPSTVEAADRCATKLIDTITTPTPLYVGRTTPAVLSLIGRTQNSLPPGNYQLKVGCDEGLTRRQEQFLSPISTSTNRLDFNLDNSCNKLSGGRQSAELVTPRTGGGWDSFCTHVEWEITNSCTFTNLNPNPIQAGQGFTFTVGGVDPTFRNLRAEMTRPSGNREVLTNAEGGADQHLTRNADGTISFGPLITSEVADSRNLVVSNGTVETICVKTVDVKTAVSSDCGTPAAAGNITIVSQRSEINKGETLPICGNFNPRVGSQRSGYTVQITDQNNQNIGQATTNNKGDYSLSTTVFNTPGNYNIKAFLNDPAHSATSPEKSINVLDPNTDGTISLNIETPVSETGSLKAYGNVQKSGNPLQNLEVEIEVIDTTDSSRKFNEKVRTDSSGNYRMTEKLVSALGLSKGKVYRLSSVAVIDGARRSATQNFSLQEATSTNLQLVLDTTVVSPKAKKYEIKFKVKNAKRGVNYVVWADNINWRPAGGQYQGIVSGQISTDQQQGLIQFNRDRAGESWKKDGKAKVCLTEDSIGLGYALPGQFLNCSKSATADFAEVTVSDATLLTDPSGAPCEGLGCTFSNGVVCNPGVNEGRPLPNPTTDQIKNAKGVYTAIGCIPTEPKPLIEALAAFSARVAGGIALLLMVFGAIQMVTSQGNAEVLKKGQGQFEAAITGLLFIIFSILLLQIIGVDILDIPGFNP